MGPLTPAKAVIASQTLQDYSAQVILLSEGNSTIPLNKSAPLPGCELHNSSPQFLGGTALINSTYFPYSYTILHNTPQFSIAKASPLYSSSTIQILQIYISPQQNRDVSLLSQCLEKLTSYLNSYTIIAGDFNAPIGSNRRIKLKDWCLCFSLKIMDSSPTHHRPLCQPTTLDLFIVPIKWQPHIDIKASSFEHKPVIITFSATTHRSPLSKTIAWKRLSSPHKQQQFLHHLQEFSLTLNPFNSLINASALALQYTIKRPYPFLQSIQNRSRAADKVSIALIDLDNYNDIHVHRKSRVEALSYSNKFWKLFTSRNQICPDPSLIAQKLQPIYCLKTYPAKNWACAQSNKLIKINSDLSQLDRPFTALEISSVLQWIGRNKAPGPDLIPHLALKVASKSPNFINKLADFYNNFLTNKNPIPKLKAILHPIPKPDGNIRPIMIQEKQISILEALIWHRLRYESPDLLNFPNQFGFTPQTGCNTHFLQTRFYMKHLQTACFLDLSQAFDSVPRDYIIACLGEIIGNKFGRFFALISRLTLQPRTATIAPTAANISIIVETGVPQGGILSPWLFNCVMHLLQQQIQKIPHTPQPQINLYADDIALFAANVNSLQHAVDAAFQAVTEWGGQFNVAKTEFLTSLKSRPTLKINNEVFFPKIKAKLLGRLLHWRQSRTIIYDPQPFLNKIQSRLSDGLPPRLAMIVFYAKYWSKVLYAAEVFPPPLKICHIHLSTLRFILQLRAFRSHRCVIQREAGALFHPIIWVHIRIISLLKKLNPSHRSALLEDNQWWESASKFLGDSRTRDSILSDPQLLVTQLASHISDAIITDAKIKGIYKNNDPVWHPPFLFPKAYLSLRHANIATLFRAPSMNSPDYKRVLCPFCMNGEDSGFHYTYQCSELPDNLCLTRETLITQSGSCDLLRFSDDNWVKTHHSLANEIISWMKDIYKARAQHNSSIHNRRLFYDTAIIFTPVLPNKTLSTNSPTNLHQSSITPSTSSLSCPTCHKTFKTESRLRLHSRYAYHCRQQVSITPVNQPNQQLNRNSPTSRQSNNSSVTYDQSTTLSPLLTPTSTCLKCHKQFAKACDLSKHQKLSKNCQNKRFNPPTAPHIPESTLQSITSGNQCLGCQVKFYGPGYLRSHLRLHKSCPAAIQVQQALSVPQTN